MCFACLRGRSFVALPHYPAARLAAFALKKLSAFGNNLGEGAQALQDAVKGRDVSG